MLSNRIVNLTGPTFAIQKSDAEGVDIGRVAQAFEAAFTTFHIDDLVDRIHALDGNAPAEAQTMMMVETAANLRLLAGSYVFDPELLRSGSIVRVVERNRDAIAEIRALLPAALSPLVMGRVQARADLYCKAGAPADIAHDVALVRALASARETLEISAQTQWPFEAVLFVQHQVGEQLGLDRMRSAARDLQPRDHWDRLALQRVADDLPRQQSELAIAAIRHGQAAKASPSGMDRDIARRLVEAWVAPRQGLADRLMQPMRAFDLQGGWSLAKLVLLGDAVREFVYACHNEASS